MYWLYAFNIGFILDYIVKSSMSIGFAKKESIRAEQSFGEEPKKKYMKQHILYIKYFSIIWMLFLSYNYAKLNYHERMAEHIFFDLEVSRSYVVA